MTLQIFPAKHPPTYHDSETTRNHGENEIHDSAKVVNQWAIVKTTTLATSQYGVASLLNRPPRRH